MISITKQFYYDEFHIFNFGINEMLWENENICENLLKNFEKNEKQRSVVLKISAPNFHTNFRKFWQVVAKGWFYDSQAPFEILNSAYFGRNLWNLQYDWDLDFSFQIYNYFEKKLCGKNFSLQGLPRKHYEK